MDREHGVPPWRAGALFFHGWALAQLGDEQHGLGEMREGLNQWRRLGLTLFQPFYLAVIESFDTADRKPSTVVLAGTRSPMPIRNIWTARTLHPRITFLGQASYFQEENVRSSVRSRRSGGRCELIVSPSYARRSSTTGY